MKLIDIETAADPPQEHCPNTGAVSRYPHDECPTIHTSIGSRPQRRQRPKYNRDGQRHVIAGR
jgi:hypothetical protein